MIKSFACKHTAKLFEGHPYKKWDAKLSRKGLIKLEIINASTSTLDLKIPPSNRLHGLSGDKKGFLSVSINMQWRIIFRWKNNHAYDVEIIDYH